MQPSDTEANAILDNRFKNRGSNLYLALSTTVPTFSAGVWTITEPVASSYARVSVAASSWSTASARTTQATVTLPTLTQDWGDITGWALMDASSGGTVRWAGRPADTVRLLSGTSGFTVVLLVDVDD